MKRTIVFQLILCQIVLGVEVTRFYEAQYGDAMGEYAHGFFGPTCGEACAVPRTFYVDGDILVIDDCENERLVICNAESMEHYSIARKGCLDIGYFDAQDSVVITRYNMAVARILSTGILEWAEPFAYDRYDSFSLFVKHSSGYSLVIADKGNYVLDSSYTLVEHSDVPFQVKKKGVVKLDANADLILF